MIASDWLADGASVVVADQRALVGRADLPVPPDRGGQGQQSLGDSDPDPGKGTAAVAFQPELALEGLEGVLDPLPEAAQRPPAGAAHQRGRGRSLALWSATNWSNSRPAKPFRDRPTLDTNAPADGWRVAATDARRSMPR